MVLTWIARDGSIYLLTGAASSRGRARYEGVLVNFARSFRPLTAQQRDSIRETRLRIASARAGESLKQLGARTANAWDLQRTAVFNDLFANATLREGQLVKIAVSQPYRPKHGGLSPSAERGGAPKGQGPGAQRHSTANGLDHAAPPSS